ncbi:hypothetical protein V1283_005025 [Bradyrhizobium sp. AZCC 2262]|jgi:hypothetical protein|uniref:hypothetical protein n=1 Tax=Bradyrhizobium sp. AZCC 2262 TaxID=3117022 RepID=UPI002FF31E16
MHKLKLLSAALLTAATFATPALAAGHASRHLVTNTHSRVTSTMQPYEGDSCIRAPRVGAFATEPWTDAAPCEPYTGY